MTTSRWLTVATFVAVSSLSSGIHAAEYFIDPAGSDSKSGTSAADAWASLTNLSKVKVGDTVNFKAGGQWTTTGGITVNGATYRAYGSGARPRIDGVKVTFATIQLGDNAIADGFKATADSGFGIYIKGSKSIVRNCEIDGTNSGMQMALGVMGSNNLVTQNYAHDLSQNTGDTGNVNSSGGAECFVVFSGSDIEVSYNSAIRCACKDKTLGGDEGGCVEIINPFPQTPIERVSFHHNYCEQDVGLFEACTGSGTGKEDPSKNPGTIKDITLAYNFVLDSKWVVEAGAHDAFGARTAPVPREPGGRTHGQGPDGLCGLGHQPALEGVAAGVAVQEQNAELGRGTALAARLDDQGVERPRILSSEQGIEDGGG